MFRAPAALAHLLAGLRRRERRTVDVLKHVVDRVRQRELVVRAGVEALGGKGGGGPPDMAQGGGPDGAKADEAIAAVRGKLSAG